MKVGDMVTKVFPDVGEPTGETGIVVEERKESVSTMDDWGAGIYSKSLYTVAWADGSVSQEYKISLLPLQDKNT